MNSDTRLVEADIPPATTNYTAYGTASGPGVLDTIAIQYSASAHTLAFLSDNTLEYTMTGVTASNIAALQYVSLDNAAFASNPGTFENFTLTVEGGPAVPEPASAGPAGSGCSRAAVRAGVARPES